MISDPSQLGDELALFADLGTAPPDLKPIGKRLVTRLFRDGEELELTFDADLHGRIIERSLDGEGQRTHASYAALLASERFGDLRRWADAQKAFLDPRLRELDRNLVTGVFPDDGAAKCLQQVDDILASWKPRDAGSVQVLLIDGPAGIGKTKFIEFLALSRARDFKTARRPLILHVQSRGRMLTFLQDLIAFSLQTLRLNVTYDQVPVLARHGLVSIAIDGFDELGDPNGYDLAWGQVNDLVNEARDEGTLILAGRETFIGREPLFGDVSSLSEERDVVRALSLQPPTPDAATAWLRSSGWSTADLESTSELFEIGSYALRPFFLAQLADREVAAIIRNEAVGSPLPFLVALMTEREASKFGDAVATVMPSEQRKDFVRKFLREIARNMADDQTDALDEPLMGWLVEVVAPDDLPPDVLSLLKNRAAVMAFLTTDDRPRYRRFAHSQLFNHFLGEETIDLIGRREMPRYVRRNILGADFLSAFDDLASHLADSDPARVRRCFDAGVELAKSYLWTDRGARNIGGLLISLLPAIEPPVDLRLEDLHVDEALLRDVAPPATMVRVAMNQFNVRGADLRALRFVDTTIVTLIVDHSTRVPDSFPAPSVIRSEGLGTARDRVIRSPREIAQWLDRHGRKPVRDDETVNSGLVPAALCDHDMVRTLEQACRSRAYWIPESRDDGDHGNRFVEERYWPALFDLLKAHELIRTRTKSSSGRESYFFHIVNRQGLLQGLWDTPDDSKVRDFYHALVERIADE